MVMAKDSNFTDLNNEGILKTLEQIEGKASSFLNLSLQFGHMAESLKKKGERLRVVEAREKEVALLEECVSEKLRVLEEKEMDFDMIQVLEASLLRFVVETQTEVAVKKKLEDVTSECEGKKEESRLVLKSMHEKLSELEKAEKGFDVKQRLEMERLEARKNELSSIEEAVKVIHAELKRKEEKFELKAEKWREETELKSKDLEIREKTVEEMMKELELKQIELEERSKQQLVSADHLTRKRSNIEVDVSSLTPPAKKHKSEEADLACASKDGDIGGTVCEDKSDKDPRPLTCPDGKSRSSFAVDQVWALYDPRDDMPRIYAQIRRIFSSQLSLQVVLLEQVRTTKKSMFASACGKFEYGDTEIKSHLMFAHEMHHIKCDNSVIVNPRKGETWALFRDWDISWNSHSDLLEPPYRYDLVEVITEFDDQLGISVAYMGRLEGFESHGLIKTICPGQMQRFSHKVAMRGEEKEEVPSCSFRLDPAATPGNDHVLEKVVETSIQSKDCVKAPTVETQEGFTKDQPIIIE